METTSRRSRLVSDDAASRQRSDAAGLLALLCALFVGRVVAQVVQAVTTVGWLPPFDSWQSGALPYAVLLPAQLVIIVVQVSLIGRVLAGRYRPSERIRSFLLVAGFVYVAAMLVRLVGGLTFANGHSFFDAPLPTTFHFVLAAFVLTAAVAGDRDGALLSRVVDAATYPAVIVGAVLLLVAVAAAGAPVQVASYGAVAAAAVVIIVLERVRPYRRAWQPDAATIGNDAVFLVAVQMVLPLIVSGAVVFAVAGSGNGTTAVEQLWPHDWPIVVQVVAMLVIGDVFRYWLHRAFHTWQAMWNFHAVHHAPHELYWLNVGRFHPLEKAGQLLFDTLPFVVLGVGEEVLAGYFVFYAVNGFFQHSNCRVRLGPLNWVISGPELHRWHHSVVIAESNANYGNNLIVWDVLFGTRFLPADREVGDLGLRNRAYPQSFVAQMTSVFDDGLDKRAPVALDAGGGR